MKNKTMGCESSLKSKVSNLRSYYLILFESAEVIEVHPVISPFEGGQRGMLEVGKGDVGTIQCRIDKETYLQNVNKLLAHIKRGDIFEINYCIDFFCEDAVINPHRVFKKLNELTQAPFAQLLKYGDEYIICASPERFIQKRGNTLITQPMKGTARRSIVPAEDEIIKNALRNNLKEQTENVMAVDVSRNDLSQVAKKGTVEVTELFGVHTFKNVHQMVSTVSCKLRENISFEDIIKATFPPASMTGAPKLKAMELIKKYELSPRGIYSGALGVVDSPFEGGVRRTGDVDVCGDFDLCVVIRTLIYNERLKRISFHVGSAITAQCNPEEEWAECLLKAETIFKALV